LLQHEDGTPAAKALLGTLNGSPCRYSVERAAKLVPDTGRREVDGRRCLEIIGHHLLKNCAAESRRPFYVFFTRRRFDTAKTLNGLSRTPGKNELMLGDNSRPKTINFGKFCVKDPSTVQTLPLSYRKSGGKKPVTPNVPSF